MIVRINCSCRSLFVCLYVSFAFSFAFRLQYNRRIRLTFPLLVFFEQKLLSISKSVPKSETNHQTIDNTSASKLDHDVQLCCFKTKEEFVMFQDELEFTVFVCNNSSIVLIDF